MELKPDEKKSFAEMLASVVEIKAMPPFVDINISELFKIIIAANKQW